MPKKKKGGGGGSGMPQGFNNVIEGVQDWNQNFHGNADGAVDYAQNNPWGQAVMPWMQNTMSGNMANNPWMSTLYGNVSGVNMGEGLDYLRQFLGGVDVEGRPSPGGVGHPYQPRPGEGGRGSVSNNPYYSRTPYGNSSSSSSGSGGAGKRGVIPDSTVGDGWFSENIHNLFDPSVLDPANNPTMQPTVDALQREAEESYWASMHNLTNQMEGAGRFGSGTYQMMQGMANEEYNEALQGQLANMYMQERNNALQRQMEALGLVNTRDIAAGQISSNDRNAAMSARAAGAANSAALAQQAELAREQMHLQGIGQMLQAQQFGLGMQGDMAGLMQQGQLGAGQLGLGFGQLGMTGYDAAANFGQLGLGAMGQLGGIYGQAASNRLRQQQMQESNRRWNEQAPIRDLTSMIDIMSGLNQMGGYNEMPGFVPDNAGPDPGGFNWGDALGGIMQGYGSWLNWGQ